MQIKNLDEYNMYTHLTKSGQKKLQEIEDQFGSGIISELDSLFAKVPGVLEDNKFYITQYQNNKNNPVINIKPNDTKQTNVVSAVIGTNEMDPDAYEISNYFVSNSKWIDFANKEKESSKKIAEEKTQDVKTQLEETPELFDAPEETKKAIEEYEADFKANPKTSEELDSEFTQLKNAFEKKITEINTEQLSEPEQAFIASLKELVANFDTIYTDVKKEEEQDKIESEEMEFVLGDMNKDKEKTEETVKDTAEETIDDGNTIKMDFGWGDIPGKTNRKLNGIPEPQNTDGYDYVSEIESKLDNDVLKTIHGMNMYNEAGNNFVKNQAIKGMREANSVARDCTNLYSAGMEIKGLTNRLNDIRKIWDVCKDARLANKMTKLRKLDLSISQYKAKKAKLEELSLNLNVSDKKSERINNKLKQTEEMMRILKNSRKRLAKEIAPTLNIYGENLNEAFAKFGKMREMQDAYGFRYKRADKLERKMSNAAQKLWDYQQNLRDDNER